MSFSYTPGNAITGARALFGLQGTTVGYATDVSVSEALNYEPLNCVGNIRVVEWVPTGYEVTLTAGTFKIFGNTVKSNNWFPNTGNSEAQQLQNILTQGDLTATLTDRKSNLIFCTVTNVKVSGHNYTVNARGVVGEQVSFVCIATYDESETAGGTGGTAP